MNIIRYKYIFLGISGVFVFASLCAIILFGFRLGIDFEGGAIWNFRIAQNSTLNEIEEVLRGEIPDMHFSLEYDDVQNTFIGRFSLMSEENHQQLRAALESHYPEFQELSFQSIGPSVGNELWRKSLTAIVLVLISISLYVAFAFRKVSRPIKSWKYGIVTLLTLFHDVIIPMGLLAFLGRYGGLDFDSNFVVALLVVVGFSVHDTIVVFDRIRENLFLNRGGTDFSSIINTSILQTLNRSINTSATLIVVLIVLYVIGPASLSFFVLTLLVGVVAGTYSSIFIASPALLFINKKGR